MPLASVFIVPFNFEPDPLHEGHIGSQRTGCFQRPPKAALAQFLTLILRVCRERGSVTALASLPAGSVRGAAPANDRLVVA